MLYGFIWKYNTPLHPLLVKHTKHTNIAISGYNSIFRQNRIHIWFILAWAPRNLTWSPLKSWILDLLKDSTTNKTCSSEIPQVVQWNHGLRTYGDKNFSWIQAFLSANWNKIPRVPWILATGPYSPFTGYQYTKHWLFIYESKKQARKTQANRHRHRDLSPHTVSKADEAWARYQPDSLKAI